MTWPGMGSRNTSPRESATVALADVDELLLVDAD
jgi:hypothetical protein